MTGRRRARKHQREKPGEAAENDQQGKKSKALSLPLNSLDAGEKSEADTEEDAGEKAQMAVEVDRPWGRRLQEAGSEDDARCAGGKRNQRQDRNDNLEKKAFSGSGQGGSDLSRAGFVTRHG